MDKAQSPITACIINYRGRRLLAATLHAVLAQQPPVARVLLIDNASDDGSVEFVRSCFPQIGIIVMPSNLGPGPAREVGLRAATTPFVCMIDNDVAPEAGCTCALMIALSATSNAVLAMPRVVFAEDPELLQYDGAVAHFLGLMAIENQNVPLPSAPASIRPIGSLIGACFLVDRVCWGDRQLHADDFFIYHEDHDLGLRARQLGLSILSVPAAVCRHRAGTPGLSLRSTGSFTARRIVCTIANRWRVILMRYQLRTIVLIAPTLILFEMLLLAGCMKKGWTCHWRAALRLVWLDRLRIMAERHAWQGHRRTGDGAVLASGRPPFHPQLLETKAERLGYRLLDVLGRANWTLVRPMLNDAWRVSGRSRISKNKREA